MSILQRQISYVMSDRYTLDRDEEFLMTFKPPKNIVTPYCTFFTNGILLIRKGFQWSANFPAVNTPSTRPASLVHDLGYMLIKEKYLPRKLYKDLFDMAMRDILLECGILDVRAWAWYQAVQIGGDDALDSKPPRIYFAPSNPDDVPRYNNPLIGRPA
jgi:hypothetical protein